MNKKRISAVILAAGPGIKLSSHGKVIPRCLITIGNKTILEQQTESLKSFCINDIYIVIGKEGESFWTKENCDKIRKIMGAKNVIVSEDYLYTHAPYSLYLGLKKIANNPVIAVEGDIIFERSMLSALVNNSSPNMILSKKVESSTEGITSLMLQNNYLKDSAINLGNKYPVYAGLFKISPKLSSYIKNEMSKKQNKSMHMADLLKKLARFNVIHNVSIEKEEAQDGIIDLKFLKGGSFAHTKKITKKDRTAIVRKEAIAGKKKLIDEINWIKNLPACLKPYFQPVLDYKVSKDSVYYEMPYTELPTLRQLLIKKKINAKEAMHILEVVLDFMFLKFYTLNRKKSRLNYISRIHLKRIVERLDESIKMAPIFQKIIFAKKINFNGKEIENFPVLFETIQHYPSFLKTLEPKFTSKVHGDLHFDNILIDLKDKKKIKFKFLDPRGLDDTYEYTYDLGKLYHSFLGFYDFIHSNMFSLKYSVKDGIMTANLVFKNKSVCKEYDKICKQFPKLMQKYSMIKNDKNWMAKSLFANISHFCSVMPFHMENDGIEKKAVAMYLMGIKMFNDFTDKYLSRLKGNIRSKIVNINAPQDLVYAKKLFKKEF